MGNTSSGTGHTATPPPVSPPSLKDLHNLPSSVTVLKNPLGSDIYLVGVNHVSTQSSEDVRETIQKVRPDTVYLEISRERLSSITYNGPSKMQPLAFFNATAFAQSLMARISFYQGAILDVRPGAEFRAALDEAKKIDANVILGDRVSDITWNRVMRSITLVDVLKALPACVSYAREFTRLPTKDAMKQHLLDTMPTEKTANDPVNFLVPSAYPVIVTEKDKFIASVLRECPGKRVVAVVGKGHVAGIKEHINDTEDPYLLRAELSRTSRLTNSPLAIQSAVATGLLTAANGVVAATMARAINRSKPARKYRGTIPCKIFRDLVAGRCDNVVCLIFLL